MKSIGNRGEDLAVEFLTTAGFEIVERNYRFKRGEIDIIAKKEGVLCFVEVKLRSRLDFGEPEQFVGSNQKQLILATADEYIYQIDWKGDIRFDIIAINETEGSAEVNHFRDAFY